MKVNTVCGQIDAGQLGRTLMHEHFIFGYPGFAGDITLAEPEESLFQTALGYAKTLKAQGVDTVIDATPNDCGRDPLFLRRLSEESGVQIICSTGYYFAGLGATGYFTFRKEVGYDIVEEIAEMMITEIEKGIAKTGIRPGVIKLASSENEITGYEECFFKAASKAQQATGVVIITHTEAGTMGPQQAQLLIAEGAAPGRIAIGHMCGSQDIDYHLAVLKQGVYDAFDRFDEENIFASPTDEKRAELMERLMDKGYEDKLLMSQDAVCTYWGRPVEFHGELEPEANIIITRMMDDIVPMLLRRGWNHAMVNGIMIDNVRRLFAE